MARLRVRGLWPTVGPVFTTGSWKCSFVSFPLDVRPSPSLGAGATCVSRGVFESGAVCTFYGVSCAFGGASYSEQVVSLTTDYWRSIFLRRQNMSSDPAIFLIILNCHDKRSCRVMNMRHDCWFPNSSISDSHWVTFWDNFATVFPLCHVLFFFLLFLFTIMQLFFSISHNAWLQGSYSRREFWS